MSAGTERFLKDRICSNCHFAVMIPFEDSLMAAKGWVKCPTCGFCKQVKNDQAG